MAAVFMQAARAIRVAKSSVRGSMAAGMGGGLLWSTSAAAHNATHPHPQTPPLPNPCAPATQRRAWLPWPS